MKRAPLEQFNKREGAGSDFFITLPVIFYTIVGGFAPRHLLYSVARIVYARAVRYYIRHN